MFLSELIVFPLVLLPVKEARTVNQVVLDDVWIWEFNFSIQFLDVNLRVSISSTSS